MHPKDLVWEYYYADDTKYKNDHSHKNAWCHAELSVKASQMEAEEKAAHYTGINLVEMDNKARLVEATKSVNPICGRIKTLIDHLLECKHVVEETRIKIREHQTERREIKEATKTKKKARAEKAAGTAVPEIWQEKFPKELQNMFNRDLCDVFVACGFAWNALSNPVLEHFFGRWVPGAEVPDRRTVSESILAQRVGEVQEAAKLETRGRLAMGQCDGWKNIARDPVVVTLMVVRGQSYILRVHPIGPEKKNADNLLKLIKQNMEEAQIGYGIEWVGWCSDAGGDSLKARTLLYRELPHLVCPDCYAHVINLVVGDLLKVKVNFVLAASRAQNVIKWFNNHSRALGWLREEQQHSLQKKYALLYPVLTRWTSIHMALQRLLDCLPAFRGFLNNHNRLEIRDVAGADRKSREKALEIYETISDDGFWQDIARLSRHLEPLTIAAHVTEGTSTRLDQVLLTLANLYRIYSTMNEDAEDHTVSSAVCGSLLRRFGNSDQDPMILAVFLNPYIQANLFNKESGEFLCATVIGLIVRVWRRLFSLPDTINPDPKFLQACSDYYTRNPSSVFSNEAMNLALHERAAHSQGLEVDVVRVWEELDDSTFTGRNCLVKLAIRLLSVVANSASCERLFSQMGAIHTKQRSRLNIQRVRDTVVLKNSLLHEFDDDNPIKTSQKRKIRDFDLEDKVDMITRVEDDNIVNGQCGSADHDQDYIMADTAAIPLGAVGSSENFFSLLANHLLDEVAEEDTAASELEAEQRATSLAASARPVPYCTSFGRPSRTSLSGIFNYSLTTSHGEHITSGIQQPNGVGMYWRGAIKTMKQRLEELELFQGLGLPCEEARA